MPRGGVLAHVGEGALGSAQEGYLDDRGQGREVALHPQLGSHTGLVRLRVQDPAQRGGEPAALELLGRQRAHDAAGLDQVVGGRGLNLREQLGPPIGVGDGTGASQQQDGREALRERVVDVPREARALREDAGLLCAEASSACSSSDSACARTSDSTSRRRSMFSRTRRC
ncbi:hypothetical protein GCM10025862_42620 [Arsenicicoccus piscis]|uniref:Uncharacterized protein n=1 Tax=Arsenicicoccus piscis TaxID=673954 RepID=A0ABQ6HUR2_9MICO|nr:hypothetical protein GCM10025862_42620 [Arsenicicoccus piscis]